MRLLLDVDGILADWAGAVVQVIENMTGRTITPEVAGGWLQLNKLGFSKHEQKDVEWCLNTTNFCADLEVLPGSLDGVKEIYRLGVPITFVTSPWTSNPTWEYERREWLRKHGFWHPTLTTIVSTDQKFLVDGSMFVDDRDKHVAQWQNFHRGPAFLWSTPWNQQAAHLPRLDSWEQLIRELKKTAGLAGRFA